MKKRIISLVLIVIMAFSLCVPAAAARTEKVEINYRAIKLVLNGKAIVPCDVSGNTVEPFIMRSSGTTYLPLRAVAQALGLGVQWDGPTNTVTLTSGGEIKVGAGPAGTTTGKQKVDITYRDIKVFLDGVELKLVNVNGDKVEPFILKSNSSVYLPLRVIGEALGLKVGWDGKTSTVSLEDSNFEEYKEIVCKNACVEAETYASKGDYPAAITAIDTAIGLVGYDDELVAKRAEYVYIYVAQTISAAKAQYIEYNYESIIAAEDILEAALKILPDNEVLLAELAYYKEREPVKLLDLSVSPNLQYNVSTATYDYVGSKSDVAGVTYNDSIAPTEWYETSHPYGWSETYSYAHYAWLLDYQYTKVTGTFFFSESYINSSIDVELTITPSNGTRQTYFVSNNGQTQYFDVDLTGAKDFEIALRQSEINGTYAYLANVYVWK